MSDLEFSFSAPLWLWTGKGAWHFITVPEDISHQIKAMTERRGFGSVRVTASIGGHNWKTSVFPDSKSGCYFLPVKAKVRRVATLAAGQNATVHLGVDIS